MWVSHLPSAKWARAARASILLLIALTSQTIPGWHYQICPKFIGVTSIPTNSPQDDNRLLLCSQGCHNNAQASLMKDKLKSGDHSLQGLVPMALKADLTVFPTDSILNSLSGWNLQGHRRNE